MADKRIKCVAQRKVRLMHCKKAIAPQTMYSIYFDSTWKKNVRESYMRGESKEQKTKTMQAMSLR